MKKKDIKDNVIPMSQNQSDKHRINNTTKEIPIDKVDSDNLSRLDSNIMNLVNQVGILTVQYEQSKNVIVKEIQQIDNQMTDTIKLLVQKYKIVGEIKMPIDYKNNKVILK